MDRILDERDKKMVLVSAPAGYGKTTLLTELVHRKNVRAAWISLDHRDNEPIRFISYLAAALEAAGIRALPPASAAEKHVADDPPDIKLHGLVERLADSDQDVFLMLDDYHAIDNLEIHRLVGSLLENLPLTTRLAIATRKDPPLYLSRLRVCEKIIELRAPDLRFDMDETGSFFKASMETMVPARDIGLLAQRTEGWAAGLKLAALSMQGCKDTTAFVQTLTGDNRYIKAYLVEEVLNRQTGPVRQFLLQTAFLDQLSGTLCDAVTGRNDSRQRLADLEEKNLFIVPLDDTQCWYRYHHLFGGMLRQKMEQEDNDGVRKGQVLASKWFEQNGFNFEAIDYALAAGDFERCAKLLDATPELEFKWEHDKRFKWLALLPKKFIYKRPNLCFSYAWMLSENGRPREAEEALGAVERAITPKMGDPRLKEEPSATGDLGMLWAKSAALRTFMAAARGDSPNVFRYAEQALEHLPKGPSIWRPWAWSGLGLAQITEGNYPAGIDALCKAQEESRAATNFYSYFRAGFYLIPIMKEAGRLASAREKCRELMGIVAEEKQENCLAGDATFLTWGDLLYEKNELDKAEWYMTEFAQPEEDRPTTAHRGWRSYCLMRLLTAKQDFQGVDRIIAETEGLVKKACLPDLLVHRIGYWKARVWLLKGQTARVADWLRENGVDPGGAIPPAREYEYLVLARYLILSSQPETACHLLNRIILGAEQGERFLNRVEALLIKTGALEAMGRRKEALDTLSAALVLAEPEGYIRIFLNEGVPLAGLLKKFLDQRTDGPRIFARKLLREFELDRQIPAAGGMVERLSRREREVLEQVAEGLSNKELSERLYISLNTAKTHLKNIYGKLGVRNRTQALFKSKELGIL